MQFAGRFKVSQRFSSPLQFERIPAVFIRPFFALIAESDAGGLKETTNDVSEQLLPRPLLVIKGTSSGTVTLEWEWALLPEQIGDWDIVYSVLVLGSKFQTNINSSFW